jgi:Flp pilus assembly pilin Flp
MGALRSILSNLSNEADGQDLVEDSLLLAFIALATIALLSGRQAERNLHVEQDRIYAQFSGDIGCQLV